MYSAVRRHPHVVHTNKAPGFEESHGRFAFASKRLWVGADGKSISCSWYEVPPGKQAFPHHFHSAVEEAVFVLEGKGATRIGDERIPISAGDYITYPPGPASAHSIINTSDEPLRYLCMSTVTDMDIIVYPDSNKISFGSGFDPAKTPQEQTPWIAKIIRDQPSIGYYDGEDGESDASKGK
ncbi:MAG: cupin domain-containing protein [Steroidobacter sp.]